MDDSGTRPDYVMKADDDAFIMLDELEKRLRVTPRTLTYWGCKLINGHSSRRV